MTLEMPDVETEPKKKERTPEEKRAAQARAHAKWRAGPKGKAYALRLQAERKKPKVNEPAS